ncbi:MAG: GNAT family N-acetyltransferase [Acetobacteraceae bacterium]|nr:GNAT family N-acetyltransferase [Acetobacteraceae bacterium]MSP29506.1 GNAT family N-acetyltransferase [Acetobacteraceae bacterium]
MIAPVILRDATVGDVAAVMRLVRGLADYEKLTAHCVATEADYRRELFGPSAIARAALAWIDGAAVGVGLWFFTLSTFAGRRRLFVEDVFVEPAHRGQGIGLGLFRHMARVAMAEGCIGMEWRVLNWNQPAIDFYRRMGATAVNEWATQELQGEALTALAV